MSAEHATYLGLVVVLGLAIGSFLNVVIARLPEGVSLWRPGSSCPSCRAPIAWYDNVPVIAYARLRGRCRACGAPISWRYPAVEIATAVLWITAYAVFGPTRELIVALVFLSALVAVTAIDLEHRIIPNVITLPGILGGLVATLAIGRLSWRDSVIGIVLGWGLFAAIIRISELVYGEPGMGGGDKKLAAMFGAFLGWKVMLVSLFAAVMVGGILAAILLAMGIGRRYPIPFGPFLALGGAIGLLWGRSIVEWYVGAFAR